MVSGPPQYIEITGFILLPAKTMYGVLSAHDRGVIGYHPTHCCQILNQYKDTTAYHI